MKLSGMIMAALLLVLATVAAARAGAEGGTVTVTVTGMRNGGGQVLVALYGTEDGFPRHQEKALRTATAPIRDGRAVVRFDGVPAGRYAASACHDENGNGRTDTNFIGMPREGVGTSNNTPTRFGPPSFEESSFAHGAGATSLEIKLRYL